MALMDGISLEDNMWGRCVVSPYLVYYDHCVIVPASTAAAVGNTNQTTSGERGRYYVHLHYHGTLYWYIT